MLLYHHLGIALIKLYRKAILAPTISLPVLAARANVSDTTWQETSHLRFGKLESCKVLQKAEQGCLVSFASRSDRVRQAY